MKPKTAFLAAFALVAPTVYAATFTGAIDNDYKTAGNWTGTITPGTVPDTANGETAQINNGSVVTYDPGGDFVVANGGTLQVTNGSWTQINAGAWIQVGAGGGNGHILVDGGTFNQGTAGNNPFAVSGTGNTFTITSGVANFSTQVNAVAGITWTIGGGATYMDAGAFNVQNGGSVSVSGGSLSIGGNLQLQEGSTWSQTGGTVSLAAGAEFSFESATGGSMSGGVLNVPKLITGVNGGPGNTFDFSGGTINIGATAFSGWYGADNANNPFNFTEDSTGVITFDSAFTTTANVTSWLTAGGIQHDNTIDASAFSVTEGGGLVTLQLIPEPSSGALAIGALGFLVLLRRRC